MIWDLILTILLVLMNGFFVAAEFAIVKVRASQLEMKVKQGNRAASMARHIVGHLDGYLAATQLGITLASLALGWIGEPVVSKLIISLMNLVGINVSEKLAHDIALPIAFALISVLHIVFGELAPKSIAIQRSEKTTLTVAYPLQFFYYLFRPFIWMLNGIANVLLKLMGISAVHGSEVHSSDEMKYLVEQSKEGGELAKNEYDLIISAFDFSERTVKHVLIPRPKVSAFAIDGFNEAALEKLIEEGYSRYPVFETTLDHVKGIVYTKDVLLKLRKNEEIVLSQLVKQALFIPENMHIGQLLKMFQRQRQQMAIVVDEYGNTTGIVTMEDLLEELVGEINDEYDEEAAIVQKIADKSYTVQAQASLHDINHYLPHSFELTGDYTTLAGVVIHELERLPKEGEKVRIDDYEVEITSMQANSISTVTVTDLL